MDSYRDIRPDFDSDLEWDLEPELIEPPSPTIGATDGSLDDFEEIEAPYIEGLDIVEGDAILPDIRRLFVIPRPRHCNGARIQAVTMLVLGLPIDTIYAFTHISVS